MYDMKIPEETTVSWYNKNKTITFAIIFFNVMVLTPVGWMATYLWEDSKLWKEKYEDKLEESNRFYSEQLSECVTYDKLKPIIDRILYRLDTLQK